MSVSNVRALRCQILFTLHDADDIDDEIKMILFFNKASDTSVLQSCPIISS